MQGTLPVILILLTSSVLVVAMFRVLRLPTMLAYFLVGLLLGPQTFGIVQNTQANQHLAEFGVVFLMFSIGLEFSLSKLRAMQTTVFGLGSAQVAITMMVVAGACLFAGLSLPTAFIVGGALAMSSTAIVSKMLVEGLVINSRHGRISIGVLLFQDLAVVPLLILIPALASDAQSIVTLLGLSMLKAIAMLILLFTFGKSVVSPWFDLVARQRSRELFVMNVLMVTLMLAFATKMADLSYALGAFIAGMLISETRYRYQVESDIAPFRDILLGLFFVTVGMLLDIQQVISNIGLILLLLFVLVLFKGLTVALLTRAFRHEPGVAIRAGVTLAQAGEFSLVILALGATHNLVSGELLQIVLATVVLSMVITPFMIQHSEEIAERLSRSYVRNRGRQIEEIEAVGSQLKNHVIICGYGRSGQYLGRFLSEEKIPFIALDIDPARVQEAAAAGENVMYGDAGRRVVLAAAGAALARALVISYNDPPAAMKILHVVEEHYPHLPVIVRTADDRNMEAFRDAGATEVVPEVLEGSLMLASHALVLLGVPLNRVVKRIRMFREEHYEMFRGYFHGISDTEEPLEKEQPRLHSIVIGATAFCVGKRLIDLDVYGYGVMVKSVRRANYKVVEPDPGFVFSEGDVVVLLGKPADLASAENALLTGK